MGEAGELERLGEANATVCAVERGLQVDPRAVRRLDLLDRGDEAVLLACLACPAGGREQVAELGDVTRERDRLDRASLEFDRTAEPPPRRLESRQRVESGCVTGDERRARAGRRMRRELRAPTDQCSFPSSTDVQA